MQVLTILREEDIDEDLLPESLDDALLSYQMLLHEHRYFDYTELLATAVDMLRREPSDDTAGPLVRHVRDHVRYVVVDEYQDTNPIQEKLIEGLCRFGANPCVVGDDDQTIYQWRGSAVRNILTFTERQEGVRTVTLDDNFGSSPGVVLLGRRPGSAGKSSRPCTLPSQAHSYGATAKGLRQRPATRNRT